jgi:hypothetical protein
VRRYRLHQIPDARADTTIDITCGGPSGLLRNCSLFTTYFFHGFGVYYKLLQRDFPIPEGSQTVSTNPATEPGSLLQFDNALRSWLSGMEQKP